MNCACGRPTNFALQPDENQPRAPVCVDCYLKFVQATQMQMDMNARLFNLLTAEAEAATGIYGALPRFPERKVVTVGNVTLNNIKVDNSAIGVLNTGSLQVLDGAVTAINQGGDSAAATAIKALTEAIANSTELAEDARSQVLEMLSVVASEAVAPAATRRRAPMRALLQEVATLIGGVAGLVQLWAQYGPVLEQLFR